MPDALLGEMTSNETSWSFPPALNITFRREFVENYNATEDAGDYKVYAVLSAAVQDLTLRERIASGFQNQGWGGEDAPVSVDDTVQGTFSTDEFMNFGLNCLLCKAGRESGSIEHACSNCMFFCGQDPPLNTTQGLTSNRYRFRQRRDLH